jgi:hypothetical protein
MYSHEISRLWQLAAPALTLKANSAPYFPLSTLAARPAGPMQVACTVSSPAVSLRAVSPQHCNTGACASVGSMVSRGSLTPPTARGARAFIHPFTLRFAVLADAKGQRHEHTARAWSPHVAAKGSETFSPPLAVVSEP